MREGKDIWRKIAFLLVLLLLSLIAYSCGLLSYFYIHNLIFPNVKIMGVNLGGLELGEAKRYIEGINEGKRGLVYGNRVEEFKLKDTGILLDVGDALRSAFSIGRRGWFKAFKEAWLCLSKGVDLKPQLKMDKRKWKRFVASLREKFDKPARNARLIVKGREIVGIEPSQMGYGIDEEKLLISLVGARGGYVELPMKVLQPRIKEEDLEGMELLSEFSTSLWGSSAGRRENIKRAVAAIDGTFLRPGERFRFNEIVGPRVSERGYKIAPVMVRGELVPGVGGGVCQVSTTLYNAVLLAGLKVIRRGHHARPVKYVPPGRDATVVYGYVDLIFENDKDSPIYIQGEVKGGRMIFRIFGRRDFEEIKVFSEIRKEKDGTIIAKTYRVIDRGNEKETELISTDIYKPLKAEARIKSCIPR
ncbi:MAG: VanW family protein [bacterium]